MTIGRNDPCPCQSGKKYKKCCLSKDQDKRQEEFEARAQELAAARMDGGMAYISAPTTPVRDSDSAPSESFRQASPAPCDPHEEALSARWNAFLERDFEGQIELYQATLSEPDLMDDEMAFAMLELLYSGGIDNRQRDWFDGLLENLRMRLPDVYESSQNYYLSWQLANAIAGLRFDVARRVACEMAGLEDGDMGLFVIGLDELAYHGQLSTLVEVMRIAWPRVQGTWDVLPWAISDFAHRLADYVIFEHLERNPALTADAPALKDEVDGYIDIESDELADYVDVFSGRTQRAWTMQDFQFKVTAGGRKRNRDDEPRVIANKATENLTQLLNQFVSYVHREEGIAYSKAAMARGQIQEYLLDRLVGELSPRGNMCDQRPAGKGSPPRQPEHPLCPDRATLDAFFARRFNPFSPQYYLVAAMFELLPAWLRFLEQSALLEPPLRTKTLEDLKQLHGDLMNLMSTLKAHGDLRESLENWPECSPRNG
jgi:SEC-C motif